jgi:uncharacterized coiled-coil protein SlyX
MSTTLFPIGGRDIVVRMCNKFPELHTNVDELQRQLTIRINEQFAWTFGPKWGGKVRAGLDPVTFRSKDTQAVLESDGTCSVWDLFQGNAEATILVKDGDAPTHANLGPEAEFIPVTPFNWLEDDGQVPEPEPPPDNAHDLVERVRDLEEVVGQQQQAIDELQHQTGRQQAQIDELLARMTALESRALTRDTPLKASGRTKAAGYGFLSHGHDVDLTITEG